MTEQEQTSQPEQSQTSPEGNNAPADTTTAPAGDTAPSGDDWRSGVLENETLKPFAEKEGITREEYIKELEKGYENISKKFGEKKEGLLGDVPKTPDEYEFESEGVFDWYKDLALEANLTKEQANTLQKKFDERLIEENKKHREKQDAEIEQSLKDKWGDDFDDRFAKDKEFFANNLSEADVEKLNGLDNSSLLLLVEVADNLRQKYQDNGNLPTGGAYSGGNLDTLEKERQEIMSSPEYRKSNVRGNEEQYLQKQKRLIELDDKIYELKKKR